MVTELSGSDASIMHSQMCPRIEILDSSLIQQITFFSICTNDCHISLTSAICCIPRTNTTQTGSTSEFNLATPARTIPSIIIPLRKHTYAVWQTRLSCGCAVVYFFRSSCRPYFVMLFDAEALTFALRACVTRQTHACDDLAYIVNVCGKCAHTSTIYARMHKSALRLRSNAAR